MNDVELAMELRRLDREWQRDLPDDAPQGVAGLAADRIEKRGNQLTEAIGFWEQHRAVVEAVEAALEQYDKDPHPADPHVLFAFVEAVARAVRS